MTLEQARNAVVIAQAARDLRAPRYGLQIAIATAIQESKLVNLTGGDRDSGGLFQQRPSQGWGSRAQVTNPALAARAFFGRAQHTSNPGLLDIPAWSTMSLTEAAQAVQRSGYPDAYAQWADVANDVAALLGGDLPIVLPGVLGDVAAAANCPDDGTVEPITVGTLNVLGASHTSSGAQRPGYQTWDKRLPGAMAAIENAGVTIAGLQEVHGPQARALGERYSAKWGMYPAAGPQKNRVIWDRNVWEQDSAQLVQLPSYGGHDVGMPLVRLRGVAGSPNAGQVIWVWSVHHPADIRGGSAAVHRRHALRREMATLTDLVTGGERVVIVGDFNDRRDGQGASHCTLTPTMTNAFGGAADPCKKPADDAAVDHIYGANLTWAQARVDHGTRTSKVSDHPLVVATTAGSTAGCAAGQGDYNLGPVKPELERLVNILGPMFDIEAVGGYRESARDPEGHPSGLAADFMVPLTPAGRRQGDRLATYTQTHARELGVDYIIWYQRIWSADRPSDGWRPMQDRGSASENHRDHVHINVKAGAKTTGANTTAGTSGRCDEVVYPIPAAYVGADNHSWHDSGPAWSTWHSGTDFGAPCGTPVYAAHAGTIEVDTTQGWAGPWLVKVSTGPGALTTWYAHMEKLTVSRGETVSPGQQIGMVGNQGNSFGCHLHFEVHLKNGSIYGPDNVDPSTWLAQNAPKSTA